MGAQRLTRDREHRMVGGVCAGIAARFGYDVTLLRVVAVLLALWGGLGIVAYLVLWALLPPAGRTTGSATDVARENVREIAEAARRAARTLRGLIARRDDGAGEPAEPARAERTRRSSVTRGGRERRRATGRRRRATSGPFGPAATPLPPGGPPPPPSGGAHRR